MDTATVIVGDFQSRFPDISTADALRLLNMIHGRILARLGIRDDTLDISLTDGTREYDLAETARQIRDAYYIASATAGDYHILTETSMDKLDLTDSGWRQRANEEKPRWFYVKTATNTNTSKKQIGFDPIPGTTTSGGYPKVTLYITEHTDLVGADTIPPSLQDSQIYLDGMSWLFSKVHMGPQAEETLMWKREYEARCHEEAAFINAMTRKEPTQYFPSWCRGRAVV